MVVRIGKDKQINIKKDIFDKISLCIKQHHYETGGIIGINRNGVITAFQFDEICNPNFYEYYPNIDFLNEIVKKKWKKSKIKFMGFVHSHLHNDVLSQQDIIYTKEILRKNNVLDDILIGIIDLSKKDHIIKWYRISKYQFRVTTIQQVIYF